MASFELTDRTESTKTEKRLFIEKMVNERIRLCSGFSLSPEAFLRGLKNFRSLCKKRDEDRRSYGYQLKKKVSNGQSTSSDQSETFPNFSKTLSDWIIKNGMNLYPTREQKHELAQLTGTSAIKVHRWFINRRRCHMNDMQLKAKRQLTNPYSANGENNCVNQNSMSCEKKQQALPGERQTSALQGEPTVCTFAQIIKSKDLERFLRPQMNRDENMSALFTSPEMRDSISQTETARSSTTSIINSNFISGSVSDPVLGRFAVPYTALLPP